MMTSYLDLTDLRTKINQMTERIVSRLKDRSRYVLNESVYIRDKISIEGRKGISFLEFALERLEQYYASLGRYQFPDQYRLTDGSRHSPVQRGFPTSPIQQVDIELKDEIIAFYKQTLKDLCSKGDDPTTYGETVYCDADLIVLLNERINIGRFVAESKLRANPSIREAAGNRETLRIHLKQPKREQAVLNTARSIALRYDLNPDVVEHCFQWLIAKTLEVEIHYLQKRFTSES
jgi:monofunctional chorismate mutase